MNKLLVSIYVVRLDEEYDLNIPIGIKVSDAIKIIVKTIKDLMGDDYSVTGSENLYRYDGYLINVNNSSDPFSDKTKAVFVDKDGNFTTVDLTKCKRQTIMINCLLNLKNSQKWYNLIKVDGEFIWI